MSATREIKVGIRIDMPPAKVGLRFFGAEEVNELIAKGWRVLSIQPGGAVLNKTGANDQAVSMVLSGCDLKILLASPDGSDLQQYRP